MILTNAKDEKFHGIKHGFRTLGHLPGFLCHEKKLKFCHIKKFIPDWSQTHDPLDATSFSKS